MRRHITRQFRFWPNFTEVRYENLSMDLNSGPPHHSRVRRDADAKLSALALLHVDPGHIDARSLRYGSSGANSTPTANPNA